MVTGVVGLPGILLDDDSFRIPRAAACFRIHIVLSIVTARQPSFTILKRPATDISREGFALMLLNGLQQIFGFLQGVFRDALQWSIERHRGNLKLWPCGLNGWDRSGWYSRLRGRADVRATCEATEQQPTKDDEYSIDLPSSIHSVTFVSRGAATQNEP